MNKILYSAKTIDQLMKKHGLTFQKSLGQNFLIDGNLIRSIVDLSEIKEDDLVLEIGPGLGALTQELVKKAHFVHAVELDDRFIPILKELFVGQPVEIIHANCLDLDYEKIFQNKALKVVANIPYYITSPIIKRLLFSDLNILSLSLMVQKELAERILASPNSKEYGSLTLMIKLLAEAKSLIKAPKEVFMPRPKVDSQVVLLKPKKRREEIDYPFTLKLFQLAFQQRRKKLSNSLSHAYQMDKAKIEDIFSSLGLDTNLRPEQLNLEEYILLANKIKDGQDG